MKICLGKTLSRVISAPKLQTNKFQENFTSKNVPEVPHAVPI